MSSPLFAQAKSSRQAQQCRVSEFTFDFTLLNAFEFLLLIFELK